MKLRILILTLISTLGSMASAKTLICNTPFNQEGITHIGFSASLGNQGEIDTMAIASQNIGILQFKAYGQEMIHTMGYGQKVAIFKNEQVGHLFLKYGFFALPGDASPGTFGKRSGVRIELITSFYRYNFQCLLVR